jgi:hypothetical protein
MNEFSETTILIMIAINSFVILTKAFLQIAYTIKNSKWGICYCESNEKNDSV